MKSASFSFYSPFNRCCWGFTIVPLGVTPRREENDSALLNRVSARYFETLGTRLLLGRTFDERDTPSSRAVAVVTEAFAQRWWPNGNPVGRRFSIGNGGDPIEVVGVVANAHYRNPRERIPPMAFLPLLQVKPSPAANQTGEYGSNFINTIEVRALGEPAAVAREIRRTLAEIDRNLPVLRVATLSDHIDRALTQETLIADLSATLGILALVLACVGLYGLMAYAVARRTGEIGIRIALGARRGTVICMVLREVLFQGAAGILIGVPAAFAGVRLVSKLLYGVSPSDPSYSAAAAVALLVSVIAAGYVPARRASRIDPLQALRLE